jgi:hypothetical protein
VRILAALLLFCASLRADFSYVSRIQIGGGEAAVTTRAIKGHRMAILTKQHTTVIDPEAETITEIDFAKKTYSVIPFAQMRKILDDAEGHAPREEGFKVSTGTAGASAKPKGVLSASESTIDIAGASGALKITVDTWVGTVPGYEQMRDFVDKVAAKMGYGFATGIMPLAINERPTLDDLALQGFDEAAKELNQSRGAPLETTIKIMGRDGTIAEASIQLSSFGGGIQDTSKFDPPAGFKKVDAETKP